MCVLNLRLLLTKLQTSFINHVKKIHHPAFLIKNNLGNHIFQFTSMARFYESHLWRGFTKRFKRNLKLQNSSYYKFQIANLKFQWIHLNFKSQISNYRIQVISNSKFDRINWPVLLAKLDWMRQSKSDTFGEQYMRRKNYSTYRSPASQTNFIHHEIKNIKLLGST